MKSGSDKPDFFNRAFIPVKTVNQKKPARNLNKERIRLICNPEKHVDNCVHIDKNVPVQSLSDGSANRETKSEERPDRTDLHRIKEFLKS